MAAPNLAMPRQGILPLTIKDKTALYSAYMPFVRGGGLFVPTAKRYNLGDEVFILLTLMDEHAVNALLRARPGIKVVGEDFV